MTIFRLAIALLIAACMTVMLVDQSLAGAHIWVVIGPPSSQPVPGSTFTTDLKISSWNGAVGALGLTISYDPTVLEIVNFSVSSDSVFDANCYTNLASYVPGQARIVCFQVMNWESQEKPTPLGVLTWRAIGVVGSTTDVNIEPATVVDIRWRPVEVFAYGQHIAIDTPNPALNGRVTLERRGDPGDLRWITQLSREGGDTTTCGIQVYEVGATNSLGTFCATSDAAGRISVELSGIDPGTYDITVKGANTLSNKRSGISLPSNTEIDFGTLRVGDSNGDDVVNGADVSYMVPSFLLCTGDASFLPYADTNKDGCVNGADVSALVPNFLEAGPIPVTGDAGESMEGSLQGVKLAGGASLSLSPSRRSVEVGDIFTLDIVANTGTGTADTVDAYVDFDPVYLEVVDASDMPATAIEPNPDAFDLVTFNAVDNVTGQINFSASRLGKSLAGGFTAASIRFRVKAEVDATDVTLVRSGARMSDLYRNGESLNAALTSSTVTRSTKAEVYLPLIKTSREANDDQ